MWWSRASAALLVAGLLAGCGFRPLYGDNSESDSVSHSLALIRVETIADRTGQVLRNFLLDRINPEGQPARPLYSLTVTVTVTRTDLGIERDETATRALLVLNAQFSLFDLSKKTGLLQGTTRSTNGFNIVDSDFATQSSERDATERAAREISEDIRTRLALYFARGRK